MSPPPRVQFFGGKTKSVGRTETFASWRAFREYLVNAGPYPSKADCPMFSAGIFEGPIKGRTPTEFTLVVGEHDACEVGVDEAVSRLEKAGIAAIIHTSASHTPERPRWRVVAPLQRPCSTEDYLEYLNLLNGALEGCLETESGDLSRRWYYGCVEGAPYEWKVAPGGALIDEVAATEHGIEPIEVKPKTSVAASAPANTEPRTDHDISRAISALQAIPNTAEARLPYEAWRDIAMALHAATGGDPRAFDALIEWTDDGQDAKTTAIWNGFRLGGGIGPGTLFKAAHDADWVDPARAPSIEGLHVLDEGGEPVDIEADAQRLVLEWIVDGWTDADLALLAARPALAEVVVAQLGEGAAAARGAIGKAAAREAGAAIEKAKTKFKSEPLAAFAQRPGIAWLIKHVLPRTGLAVIFGAPGSGKSFFALDMVAAVARGSEWRGRKAHKGRAMYIAAEGSGGFASRGRAYLQAHGLTEIDLRVIGEAPNFFTGSGDERLIAEEVRACGGADVIVIDTLSASSAGADENTGKDMNLIVGRMNELQADTGALVILIHHSGKDESKGARGWSGLKAAVDVEIEVSRPNDEEPGRVARITKQKDGESGAVFPFRLEVLELGVDEDGKSMTSCVVEAIDDIPTKRTKTAAVAAERRPRGQWKQTAYRIVEVGGTVAFDEVVDKVAAEMPRPEEGKRDQRRSNARRDVEALIRGDFLETTDGGKTLRLVGTGELL